MPNISFWMGGHEYELTSSEYIMPIRYDNHDFCLSIFREIPKSPKGPETWVLGTSFLAKYYSVFDFENDKIGFASLK